MPQHTTSQSRTGTLREFFAISAAWSVLAGALVLVVYRFQLPASTAYLLALIPGTLACAMAVLAWRRRAKEPNTDLRTYYGGAIIFAVVLLLLTVLLALFTLSFVRGFEFAMLTAAMPLGFGILPAMVLLMPKQMVGPTGLTVSPIRAKLMTPGLRRIMRMAVLYLIYESLNFASALLFDGNDPLKGSIAYCVAVLPVLPLFGLIPIYNKYMKEEQDEFQRQLFNQSILWAFLGTFVIASVMGRLQDHSLAGRGAEFFRPYSVFPVFWWLHLEAVFAVNLIQALRIRAQEKREKTAQ